MSRPGKSLRGAPLLLSAAFRRSRLGSRNPLRRRTQRLGSRNRLRRRDRRLGSRNPLRTRRLGSRNRLRRRDRRIVIKRRRHKPRECRSQSYTLSHRLVGIIIIFNAGIAIAARAHKSYLGRGDTRRKRQGSCSENQSPWHHILHICIVLFP